MPDLYEFKKIEGKGFGCVAVKAIKKGIVILQEAPLCVAKGVENFPQFNPTQSGLREFGLNIMSAFNRSIVNFAENIFKRKWGPECAEEFRSIQQKFPFEKCRRHVQIIRLLYKHGREKKAQPLCLFTLLKNGYNTSRIGSLLCWDHRNRKAQFNKDGVEFAQAAAKFGKILPKEVEDPSKWKKNGII